MKRLMTVSIITLLVLSNSGWADDSWQTVTWNQVALDTIIGGAVSYDKDGGNVVVSGSAFYTKIFADGYLGTQIVGGDTIDEEVVGNLGIYGLFTYTDAANVLGNAMSNPTQMLAFEVVANDLQIDFNNDGTVDAVDRYALDARDIEGLDFLKASFAQIAGWGYTEIAPGVWFDLAVTDSVPEGQVALSVVINGFSNAGWDAGLGSFNAYLLPGTLGEGSDVRRDSGIFVAEVPEPATMVLLGLGGLLCRKFRKA